MDLTVKKIEFVLENCEVLFIDDLNGLYNLRIGRTHTNHYVEGSDKPTLSKATFTNYVRLMFDDTLKTKLQTSHHFMDDRTPWQRLLFRDVTSIVLCLSDGSEQQFYTPWKGNGFGPNKAMRIHEDKKYELIYIIFDETNIFQKIYRGIKRIIYLISEGYWRLRRRRTKRNMARRIAKGETMLLKRPRMKNDN